MAICDILEVDTITIDAAGELDNKWMNSAQPVDGLRLVHTKKASLLTIPNKGDAPLYKFNRHNPVTGEYGPAYYHVDGPTLAQWYEAQDAADLRDTEASARW